MKLTHGPSTTILESEIISFPPPDIFVADLSIWQKVAFLQNI